jgi:hypothetical protein
LTNPSLRTALFSPVIETDQEMGNMVETTILAQWMHRKKLDLNYARWKEGRSEGEVDLVLLNNKKYQPSWAVEIKWSNRYVDKPLELKSLIHFCQSNQLTTAMITTIDKQGIQKVDGLSFTFLPASIYAYNIGKETLNPKNSI